MRHDGARSPGPLVRFLWLLLVDNGRGRRSRSHWGSVSGLRAKPSMRRFGGLWAALGRAASLLPMPQSKGSAAAIRAKAAHRTEAGPALRGRQFRAPRNDKQDRRSLSTDRVDTPTSKLNYAFLLILCTPRAPPSVSPFCRRRTTAGTFPLPCRPEPVWRR